MVAAREIFPMTSDWARHWAEEHSKQQEDRARNARKATTEYEIQAQLIREKTARLKALRLEKDATAQNSRRDR
jgi:hypothetical protein